MRVLVTGAAGFIGSHLSERLQDAGHDVWGVDNRLTGNNPGRWGECDITDRQEFYRVASRERPELIVHCAASYSDPDLWHRDAATNIEGSINVALAAHHHDARVVYFQTALPPVSSYAISKLAGGEYLRLSGVPLTVFRLANVYGPRNLSGAVPTFYRRLVAGEECMVTQLTWRDLVYIDDLMELVLLAIETEAGGQFDVCSPGLNMAWPIRAIYDAVAGAMEVEREPVMVVPAPGDVPRMDLDPGPAWQAFKWQPRTGLVEGVAAAVDWYQRHGVAETYTHLRA